MIFVTGAGMVVLGCIIILLFGTGIKSLHNKADRIGAFVLFCGVGRMLYAIGILLWRIMP